MLMLAPESAITVTGVPYTLTLKKGESFNALVFKEKVYTSSSSLDSSSPTLCAVEERALFDSTLSLDLHTASKWFNFPQPRQVA